MTDVRPFRALRYDPARVDLSRVIVPPYDVVAAEDRAAFYDRDPHNAIRLELTRDVAEEATTDYAHVAKTLAAWTAQHVLTRDAEPALYPLRQSFTAPDGTRLAREGFFDNEHFVGLLKDQMAGRASASFHLWTVMNAVLWHASWVEGREDCF